MKKTTFFIFLFPSLLLVGYFAYVCLGWNVLVSLSDWKGLIPTYKIVGLDQYASLLGDPAFWISLKNNLLLILLFVPGSLFVGLSLAILLDLKIRGEGIFRTIYLLPFALSFVVTATLWAWMYSPRFGVINNLLEGVGLGVLKSGWITDTSIATYPIILMGGLMLIIGFVGVWKGLSKRVALTLILSGFALVVAVPYLDPNVAMYSVILALMWQFSGYTMLIFLAGIKSIPESQIMAAEVDGASSFQKYKHVVIPQLKGPALTAFVILMVFTLKAFDFIWVLSMGGPGYSTHVLPVMMYKETFIVSKFSYGAAISSILFIVIMLVVVPYLYRSYIQREKK